MSLYLADRPTLARRVLVPFVLVLALALFSERSARADIVVNGGQMIASGSVLITSAGAYSLSGMPAGAGGAAVVAGGAAVPAAAVVAVGAATIGLVYIGVSKALDVPYFWEFEEGDPALRVVPGGLVANGPIREVARYRSGIYGQFVDLEATAPVTGPLRFQPLCPAGSAPFPAEWSGMATGEGVTQPAGYQWEAQSVRCYPAVSGDDFLAGAIRWRVQRQASDGSWVALSELVQGSDTPAFGNDPEARAVVVSRAECYSPSGSMVEVEAYSDTYAPTDDPAPIPPLACPDSHPIMRNFHANREVPGTDVEDEPILEPAEFRAAPAPSYVPEPQRDWWDECHSLSGAVVCDLALWNTEGQTDRRATPGQDFGWQYDPNRGSKYRCELIHPTGGAIDLPLEDCRSLAWVTDPVTGTPTNPDPRYEPQPDPDNEPNPNPTLPDPTPDGQPPAAPRPDGDCMSRDREEGEGWFSYWVFRGVSCALAAAFVPGPDTMARIENVEAQARSLEPFATLTSINSWFTSFGGIGGGGACLHLTVPILGETYKVVSSCQPGPVEQEIMSWRGWLSVVCHGMFIVPMAWWAWKQYAPGSQGNA